MIFRLTAALPLLLGFILTISPVAVYGAGESTAVAKPSPYLKTNMKLLLVDRSFIVANERKFLITPATAIQNKKGEPLKRWRLVTNRQVYIEYYFDASTKDPIAALIQQ